MKSAPDELLQNAKKAWDNGDRGGADNFCKQILDVYPESNAAQEAKEILDGLAARPVTKAPISRVPISQVQSSKYTVARGVASVIELIGWLTAVVGLVTMIYGVSQQLGAISVLGGVALIIGGFVQIMGAQIVRATVDTADNTNAILAELRKARD